MTSSSKKRLPLRKFLADRLLRAAVLPTRRLVGLAAIGSVITAAAYFVSSVIGLFTFIIGNVLLLVFAAIDFFLLPKH